MAFQFKVSGQFLTETVGVCGERLEERGDGVKGQEFGVVSRGRVGLEV